MIIEARQDLFETEKVSLSVTVWEPLHGADYTLTPDQAQALAEDLIVAAAKARHAEAVKNQPDLFAVSDMMAGRV